MSPSEGSESGAGWGLLQAVRRFADVTVLHASSDAEELARYQTEHPSSGVKFVHVPVARYPNPDHQNKIFRFIAYIRWIPRARRAALGLIATEPFDVIHHATWSVYWLPSAARGLGLPVIWGPVGGAVITPGPLRSTLSRRDLLEEFFDAFSVRLSALNPRTRAMWKEATIALFQNPSTQRRVGRNNSLDVLLNHAEFTIAPKATQAESTGEIVWVGAVESRKGPLLAVRAMQYTDAAARLVIVGEGPQLEAVLRMINALSLQDKVRTTGRIPRADVQKMMAGAAATLYTGLREEGGLALAEGLMSGRPVIVIGNGGPLVLCSAAGNDKRIQIVAPNDADTVERELAQAIDHATLNDTTERAPMLTSEAAASHLHELFLAAIASRDGTNVSDTDPQNTEGA
ncbi:MAG: glycosyltransferase family 4 protein [Acidobacteria bacterium]|nr:glycosyltransferase family 4 protein [Acidobacteriota bacterium]